ncbi:hypothetical protein ACFFX0_02625 [Citricoccus parietis]|uniref:Uncharacterized protein n=1 Tax=Citricoccus parietis TaxID=592307 RepID=A0ABV5FTY2_9MICC
MSSCASSRAPKPWRTMAWSSTIRMRIGCMAENGSAGLWLTRPGYPSRRRSPQVAPTFTLLGDDPARPAP